MNWKNGLRERGVLAALGAALLFGAGTSLAKWLLDAATGPWLLAGLRHLGTARTGAYFSVAPFFGTLLALVMGDPITMQLLYAGALMALGTWLHLTEHHQHVHDHREVEHDHDHVHDEHHQHEHDDPTALGTRNRHRHRHQPLTHDHPHFPDAHRRHTH